MKIVDVLGVSNEVKDDIIIQIIQLMKKNPHFFLAKLDFTSSNDGFYDIGYSTNEEKEPFCNNEEICEFLEAETSGQHELELALIMFFLDTGEWYWETEQFKIENWRRIRKRQGTYLIQGNESPYYLNFIKSLSRYNSARDTIDVVFHSIMEKKEKSVTVKFIDKETEDCIAEIDSKYDVCENNIDYSWINVNVLNENQYVVDSEKIEVAIRIKPQIYTVRVQPTKWNSLEYDAEYSKENLLICVNTNEAVEITQVSNNKQEKCLENHYFDDNMHITENAEKTGDIVFLYSQNNIAININKLRESALANGYKNVCFFKRQEAIAAYHLVNDKVGNSIICDVNWEGVTVSIYRSGCEQESISRPYDQYSNPRFCFEQLIKSKMTSMGELNEKEKIIAKKNDCYKYLSEVISGNSVKISDTEFDITVEDKKEIFDTCYEFVICFILEICKIREINKVDSLILSGEQCITADLKRKINNIEPVEILRCFYSTKDEYVNGMILLMNSKNTNKKEKGYEFCMWSRDYLERDVLSTLITKENEVRKLTFSVENIELPLIFLFYNKSKDYDSDLFPYDERLAEKVLKIRVDNLPARMKEACLQISANPDVQLEKCIEIEYGIDEDLMDVSYEVIM